MTELTVYHLSGLWGLKSVSPFCLKVDAFLRMTGTPHASVTAATPFGGPKRKAPWIEHEGRTLGDSSFIIAYLIDRFGIDPDVGLSADQRGRAVAIQRLVEENLYWAMVFDRWVRTENWPVLKQSVPGQIPSVVRTVIAPIARRGVKRQLQGHGIGLHSPEEIEAIARRDLEALAGMLGERDWFFGDSPTLVDATVFSLLANIRYVAFASPMKAMIEGHGNLAHHTDRFRDRFYP
jgi:glutathione S-transferase